MDTTTPALDQDTDVWNRVYPGDNQQPLHVYVLSETIFRAFMSRYSLSEIHEYEKLRKVASMEDIAILEQLRRIISFNYENMGDSIIGLFGYCGIHPTMTEEQEKEYKMISRSYVDRPEFKARVMRLFKPMNTDSPEAIPEGYVPPKSYRILSGPNSIYIVVGEGVLDSLNTQPFQHQFLKDLLKEAYGVASLCQVNKTAWYRQYVKTMLAA